MKILKSKRKDNTYSLKIEEDHSVMEEAMENVFNKLSKSVKIPGFRKGKIPRNIFEKQYGKDVLVQEAVSEVINMAYFKAIQELDLEVIDFPKNFDIAEYKENKAIVFSCDVDVRPEVKLGKYKGLKVEKKIEPVAEDTINKELENIKENYAKHETVDRKTKAEDFIRCNIEATSGSKKISSVSKKNVGIKIGTEYLGKEFDDNITGLSKDQEKMFQIPFTPDFKNKQLAGKTANFKITILEIQEKVLAELNDKFIAENSNFKTLAELKNEIKNQHEKHADQQAEDKMRNDLIDMVNSSSKAAIQQVLIDSQINQSLKSFNEQLKQSGLTLERYKELAKKSDEDLKSEFTPRAEKTILTELVLDSIAEKEKIQVTQEDMVAEVKNWQLPEIQTDEDIEKYLEKLNQKELSRLLKRKKAVDLIVDQAKIIT
ncbi:trigger factor [Candidatus Margulisiibacteriota bacterium]